jgi:hypothetical protein
MRQLEDYRYLAEAANRRGAWWERLKYIPFGKSPDAPFLTLGGEVRLRYELIDNTDFGSGPQDSGGYLLTRFMPYVALTLPNLPAGWELQLFAQFEAAFNNYDERGPGPIDQDDLLSKPLPRWAQALSAFKADAGKFPSEQSDCSATRYGPNVPLTLMEAWCVGKIHSGISMDFT